MTHSATNCGSGDGSGDAVLPCDRGSGIDCDFWDGDDYQSTKRNSPNYQNLPNDCGYDCDSEKIEPQRQEDDAVQNHPLRVNDSVCLLLRVVVVVGLLVRMEVLSSEVEVDLGVASHAQNPEDSAHHDGLEEDLPLDSHHDSRHRHFRGEYAHDHGDPRDPDPGWNDHDRADASQDLWKPQKTLKILCETLSWP
jgi:hypothetical protein